MQDGISDFSKITSTLIQLIQDWIDTSEHWQGFPPFKIQVDGSFPQIDGNKDDCYLVLNLLKMESVSTTQPLQSAGPHVPESLPPIAVKLEYLVSAMAGSSYAKEQKALTFVFQCLRNQPIFLIDAVQCKAIETKVTTTDLAKIWQAVHRPMKPSFLFTISTLIALAP
jgi:hypothetical protein